MSVSRTRVIQTEGPYRSRRKARRRERLFQSSLDYWRRTGDKRERRSLDERGVPEWAQGVRVERAGFLQWVLVATEHRGH